MTSNNKQIRTSLFTQLHNSLARYERYNEGMTGLVSFVLANHVGGAHTPRQHDMNAGLTVGRLHDFPRCF